mmetsp:Transcript_26544/g.36284  ORF Transcript_26544/g.36284 Transcript_26544/m.36284 type:complete len:264 (+) Transcript_26544:287-1078(+)
MILSVKLPCLLRNLFLRIVLNSNIKMKLLVRFSLKQIWRVSNHKVKKSHKFNLLLIIHLPISNLMNLNYQQTQKPLLMPHQPLHIRKLQVLSNPKAKPMKMGMMEPPMQLVSEKVKVSKRLRMDRSTRDSGKMISVSIAVVWSSQMETCTPAPGKKTNLMMRRAKVNIYLLQANRQSQANGLMESLNLKILSLVMLTSRLPSPNLPKKKSRKKMAPSNLNRRSKKSIRSQRKKLMSSLKRRQNLLQLQRIIKQNRRSYLNKLS